MPGIVSGVAYHPRMADAMIQLRNVHREYHRPDGSVAVAALRGIDLDIQRGRYLGIMGQSGSGKSTLMNLLGCLDRPTRGRYLLEGEDVSEHDDEKLSGIRGRRIGFIFQSFHWGTLWC